MTTSEKQAVPVAPEDREAACATYLRFRYGQPPLYTNIAAGRIDHDPIVQAFARHRLASLPCKSGEGAGEALEIAKAALETYADPTGYCDQDGEQFKADEKVHPGLLAAETLARIAALTPDAQMTQCLTPDCRYTFKIRTKYARSSYGNASIDALVLFPAWQSLAISTKQQLQVVDEILHRHMEAAVAEIGRYDLSLGGTIAKDWPALTPDATQTREAETRGAIVRDLIVERRRYNEDSPTWRAFGFCIDIAEKAALNARGGA